MAESKENFYQAAEEIDEDFEFNAPNFFDFMRVESDSEIEEQERWFEYSGDYPDSPFVVKLDFEKLLSMETLHQTSKLMHNAKKDSIRNEVAYSRKNAKGKIIVIRNGKKKNTRPDDGLHQPRSPTFLKPTLSHLLKQQQQNVCDKHSNYLGTRLSRIGRKVHPDLEMKLQKNDIGCLRKVAQSKHQFSLLHKSTKKVTTPKEAELLRTPLRAQNRGAESGHASSELDKQKQRGCSFFMHSLNKKLFHTKPKGKENSHASAKVYPVIQVT